MQPRLGPRVGRDGYFTDTLWILFKEYCMPSQFVLCPSFVPVRVALWTVFKIAKELFRTRIRSCSVETLALTLKTQLLSRILNEIRKPAPFKEGAGGVRARGRDTSPLKARRRDLTRAPFRAAREKRHFAHFQRFGERVPVECAQGRPRSLGSAWASWTRVRKNAAPVFYRILARVVRVPRRLVKGSRRSSVCWKV